MDEVAVGSMQTWLNRLNEMRLQLDAAKASIEAETGMTFSSLEKTIKELAMQHLLEGEKVQGSDLEVVIVKGAMRINTLQVAAYAEKHQELMDDFYKCGSPYAKIQVRKG